MSTLKKNLELLFLFFALLTLIMLYGQVPFAQHLIVVSLTSLGMYYLMSGALVLFDKRVERVMRMLYFVGLWSVSFGLLGMVFRLRFWHNGENILLTAFGFSAVVLLIAVVYRQTTPKEKRPPVIHQLQPLIKRLAVYPVLFFLFYWWPVDALYQQFGRYRHHEAYVEAFLEAYHAPGDSIKQARLEKLEKELQQP